MKHKLNKITFNDSSNVEYDTYVNLNIASLINSYLILPLALCLLYGSKSKVILYSCIFIIITTFSSTCYFTLFGSLVIYVFFNYLKKVGPFLIIGSTLIILVIIYLFIINPRL